MPSIFRTRAADLEATSAPAFDAPKVETACAAKLAALSGAAVREEVLALRKQVGQTFAQDLQDPGWEVIPRPLSLFEEVEVKRLRDVLPAELIPPIEKSGLSKYGQLQMGRELERKLDAYDQTLARHQDPQAVLRIGVNQAKVAFGLGGYPPARKPDDPGPPLLGVIPSGPINTLSTKRRHFRVLVWNLENFTRDRRPRGSAPIEGVRNQARIALVTKLMESFDVDLLLVMETGLDVGPAMTGIASRLESKVKAPFGVHPLVSPATGALPSVKNVYSGRNLGRRTGSKALALRTLFEVYRVTAGDRQLPVTENQVATAITLLKEASPEANEALIDLPVEGATVRGKSGRLFPDPRLFATLRAGLGNVFMRAQLKSSLPDLTYTLASDLVDLTAQFAGSTSLDLTQRPLQDLYDDLADGVQLLRELVEEAKDEIKDRELRTAVVGQAQGLELLLLFLLQSIAAGIPDGELGLAFDSDQAEGETVVLAAYLTGVSASLRFDALDPVLGPLGGNVDKDVVLGALQRLGLIDRNIETYGLVYRPPCQNALARLFDLGVKAHGFMGDADGQASQYDIVRGSLSGGGFSIQEADGLLNWRSALQVTIPVSETLSVPFALFHTRYSGTAQIKEAYKLQGLSAADADIMARVESLVLLAKALLPGHSRFGVPLIVGDFNIPQDYLDPSADKSAPTVRKQRVRARLLEGMAASGYLRHTMGARLGEGHPRTTLKAFGTLALGDLTGSQPYDGVYEPFDFARRNAVVGSGVVKCAAIITAEAMKEDIRGATLNAKEVLDLDAAETEDKRDEEGQEDDNQANVAGKVEMLTVGQAAAREVARVYGACARRLVGRIHRMLPWFEHLEKSPSRARAKTKYSAPTPSKELLHLIQKLREVGVNVLPKQIEDRQKWFAERCEQDAYGPFAIGFADPFTEHHQLFAAVLDEAERCRLTSTTLEGLKDELDQVQKQLLNLETKVEVRQAVAYRAIVSDHLPQIIELDLEPGS